MSRLMRIKQKFHKILEDNFNLRVTSELREVAYGLSYDIVFFLECPITMRGFTFYFSDSLAEDILCEKDPEKMLISWTERGLYTMAKDVWRKK